MKCTFCSKGCICSTVFDFNMMNVVISLRIKNYYGTVQTLLGYIDRRYPPKISKQKYQLLQMPNGTAKAHFLVSFTKEKRSLFRIG